MVYPLNNHNYTDKFSLVQFSFSWVSNNLSAYNSTFFNKIE